MTDTTPAWDGRPENPERDGWHWVRTPDEQDAPYQWRAAGECERGQWDARWIFEAGEWDPRLGTYLGPCLTPAEVAAHVAAAVQAERKAIAAEMDCGCANRADVLRAMDGGMRGKDAAARYCHAEPNCCAVEARGIRARGSSDAKEAAP